MRSWRKCSLWRGEAVFVIKAVLQGCGFRLPLPLISYTIPWYLRHGEVASSPRLVGLGPKWSFCLLIVYMHYVYIIRSDSSGKLYKGSTCDLKMRIREHNSGKTQSTKAYVPWTLVYYAVFADKTDALREELFLKSGKGRERINFLLANTLARCQNTKHIGEVA